MATKVCVLYVRVFEPVRFLKDRGWHQSKKERAIRNDSDDLPPAVSHLQI